MTSTLKVRTALELLLRAEGALPTGRLLTHAVIVYRTHEANPDGTYTTRRGRCYPIGETDPTMERGMLDDALHDARKNRR